MGVWQGVEDANEDLAVLLALDRRPRPRVEVCLLREVVVSHDDPIPWGSSCRP